ncbi:MAG TPA: tetratricopeptide repeat protein [Bacteroidales bacterium]|nr:tetratricopeptide repeat protein [Bacteroidales bacterium]
MRVRFLLVYLFMLALVLPVLAVARKKPAVNVAVVPTPSLSEIDRSASDYYFQEALNARQQNRFDEAFELFRYVVELDSMNSQAWYEIAVFYNNIKHPEWGVDAMERAWKLDPQNDWYTFGLANMYLTLKMIPKAVVLYEGLLKSRSSDENLHFQLATLYSQSGNLTGAIHQFDAVENLIGKNENVSLAKFKIYKDLGKPKRAIHEIQALSSDNPFDVDYILMLGDAWLDLGNLKEAFKQYELAKSSDPGNPSVALSLADYYKETGDSLKAQEQLISALTNPNTEVDTKLQIFAPILSNAMVTADSVKIASYFDILLDQHPNDYQIRELHVEYLMQKGRKDEAKAELRTVLDLNPNQLETWKKLLQLCAEANNQTEIRKVCTDAITYFPAESIFWFYLGLSWYPEHEGQAGDADYHAAIKAFEKAITVSKPDDNTFISRVYGLIGDAYLYLNDRKLCYEYYEKALTFHPGNVLVLNNYAYYLSEDNTDLAKAERMSRKTIDSEPKNATYLDTYAWIFFKEEKYSLAKIYIERAIANEPEPSSIILEHYGDILWFNNEVDAALIQWKKALELQNPSDELIEKVETGTYVSPKKVRP